eukprot:jgi/Mesvir1/22560/Mv18568-RA.1
MRVYYEAFVELRVRYYQNRAAGPGLYSVFVTDTPKIHDRAAAQETVGNYFKRLYPFQFFECHIVRDYFKLETWIRHQARAQFYLQHYQAELDWRDTYLSASDFRRPTTRLGPWGLWGKRVDAVDWYSKDLAESKAVVASLRAKALRNYTSSAFIIFRSRAAASVCAQTLHSACDECWRVEPAPDPADVCWENCKYRLGQRRWRWRIVSLLMAGCVILFLLPISGIMGLANIGRLEHNGNIQISSFLKLLLSGFLPALLLLLFMRTLLPFVTNHLSRREGWISHTEIERSALLKSSIFYNVDVIFGSLFASKVYNNLSAFLTSPLETLQGYGGTSRGTTITQTATFFLIFVMINSLVLLPMELMRPITASVFAVRTRFFCRTEFDYQVGDFFSPLPFSLSCSPSLSLWEKLRKRPFGRQDYIQDQALVLHCQPREQH